MKHFSYTIEQLTEIEGILAQLNRLDQKMKSRSLLVQVVSNKNEASWFSTITVAIQSIFPCAVVIGASRNDGNVDQTITVLSFTFFKASRLYALAREFKNGHVTEEIGHLKDDINNLPTENTGVFLFHSCESKDFQHVAEALDGDHSCPIAYGCSLGADSEDPHQLDQVYCNGEMYFHGLVAVVCCSESLMSDIDVVKPFNRLFPRSNTEVENHLLSFRWTISYLRKAIANLYLNREFFWKSRRKETPSKRTLLSNLHIAKAAIINAEKDMHEITEQALKLLDATNEEQSFG